MRKFILPLLILLVISGCKKDTGTKEEIKVPVRVYYVKPESLAKYLSLTGTISALKDQILYSKISERITDLKVKAGDRIGQGETILTQYNAILSQGLDAAKANVNNAQAQMELTEQNFARMQRLFNQRAISPQQFEQVTAQRKAAQSAFEAAQAQLKQAIEQVENSIIKAPFDGMVAAVFVDQNQMLTSGMQVAQIIDPSTMISKVRVSSRDISFIKPGQEVIVSIPSIPERKYEGKVTVIDRAVDPVSKTLEAEIVITDADSRIKSGMYGEFMIATNSITNSVIIPETALLSQTEVRINKQTGTQEPVRKYFLFIVNGQKARMKEVKVGLISEGRAQITEGVKMNDKVIIVGNNVVQEGQTVNIID
ncbi:MAG TPA: efflux RND transporter periplasmic adaptor subunit [Ignavibacteriales bacterium]|nr:efflux RND transporter periplasmic adaptor subunit [Ignavibacteriales bacterium]